MILSKNPLSLKLIELDPDMIPFLEERFSEKSFDIYLQDVLDTSILRGETEKHE
jgi:16S rRNA A1518/A1519 N6-dimethyltransferase RsmA/KsgA/DIM1 with predicted DNA glycosylase/AP lyase activity